MRIEKDILGELEIPEEVYWGINTQRAILNFQISGRSFPTIFIKSLVEVKKACLLANLNLNLIENDEANAINQAIDEILNENKFLDQFPVDIFQTGSGTQINMNVNEVLANRANEILGYPKGTKHPIHPNDHVNKSQSSNDVIPAAMHLSALHLFKEKLEPELLNIKEILNQKINEFKTIIKVGRTHLQDAVPIPLSLEFEVYRQQIEKSIDRIQSVSKELCYMPLGGTAVGTGINVHKNFADLAIKNLSKITKIPLNINPIKAEGISSHNTIVYVSSIIKALALSLLKMANDIRWMGSGPRAGLAELIIPPNEPGSSIMPGKVNPTQSEALIQVCLQVLGYDMIISIAEGYGSILDLNVCKPIMIVNLLESIEILSNAINSFSKNCLIDLKVNKNQIDFQLKNSLMVVTNLSSLIGYDKAAEIAQKAYNEGKTIKQVINELGLKLKGNLDELLDPKKMV
jgi:fumarate hydratase class II